MLKIVKEQPLDLLFEKAKNVDFDRNLDESYTNGLWDLSIKLASEKQGWLYNQEYQEKIYEQLWERFESFVKEIKKQIAKGKL